MKRAKELLDWMTKQFPPEPGHHALLVSEDKLHLVVYFEGEFQHIIFDDDEDLELPLDELRAHVLRLLGKRKTG